MRFAPWQIFVVNDCNRPLPDFLNKSYRGLLTSIVFCSNDKMSKKANVLWNIDVEYLQSVMSDIAGNIINICWKNNDDRTAVLNTCISLCNCHARLLRLTVSDCKYKTFVSSYIDYFNDILTIFDEIVILNEDSNNQFLQSDLQTNHIKRRRPCKYPFDCITIGRSGKLYPCPYVSERDFGKISQLDQACQNKDYLLFLSAHLCGFLDDYPFCKGCQYWLDGWLGEEKEFLHDAAGNLFEVLWEGHSCTIKRSRKK